MKLFPEEQQTLRDLIQEWYDQIHKFTEKCDGIFSEKAQRYDQTSPSWHRHPFPDGYVMELRKKADRIDQLLSQYDPNDPLNTVNWDKLSGELADSLNYARMFAALIQMWKERWGRKMSV